MRFLCNQLMLHTCADSARSLLEVMQHIAGDGDVVEEGSCELGDEESKLSDREVSELNRTSWLKRITSGLFSSTYKVDDSLIFSGRYFMYLGD